jgi:hypothetical protein
LNKILNGTAQGDIVGREYIKKFKKFCEPRLMPF